MKPRHAGDAYVNLDTTTALKTVCTLQADIVHAIVTQDTQSVQRLCTVADNTADVVRRQQVAAEGDAEDCQRSVAGDARQQRR